MAPKEVAMGTKPIPDGAASMKKKMALLSQKKKENKGTTKAAGGTDGSSNTVGAVSAQKLLDDLFSDNMFFDSVVDMIPVKLYVKGQSGDDFNPKYFKGQAKESKEARRAQNKQAKRAKLDPSQAETTTQIKQRLELQQEEDDEDDDEEETPKNASSGKNKKNQRGKSGGSGTGVSRALLPKPPTESSTSNTKHKKMPGKGDAVQQKENAGDGVVAAAMNNASRIDALRAKLQAKIAEKRGQRPSDPAAVSKRAARATEKKKRKEDAIARKKQKVHSQSERTANGDKTTDYKIAEQKQIVDAAQDLATVDFGILSGLNASASPFSKENYLQNNKSLANLGKTKNLKRLLADAESKKQRLEELQNSTLAADQQKAAKIHWGDVIKEATGERVKDDPTKLKKALKRKEVQKAKSSKAWKTRVAQTKSKMDERQNIRKHNLQQRTVGGATGANLSSKKIVNADAGKGDGKGKEVGAKGRKNQYTSGGSGGGAGRAGFEGKKQGFINGNKPKSSTGSAPSKKKGQ
jgi:hypothetical protein